MKKEIKKILVTGSVGQIGSELTLALRDKYAPKTSWLLAARHRQARNWKNPGHFILSM